MHKKSLFKCLLHGLNNRSSKIFSYWKYVLWMYEHQYVQYMTSEKYEREWINDGEEDPERKDSFKEKGRRKEEASIAAIGARAMPVFDKPHRVNHLAVAALNLHALIQYTEHKNH